MGGAPAWIDSSDTPLRPAPEAFGSAFLLPALHHGRTLTLFDSVDPVWLGNVQQLQTICRRWWGYRVRAPRATRGPAAKGEAPTGGRALFFSGGADSFYSLLRGGENLDCLITIQGFDIPVEDESRMSAVTTLVRSVAAEHGLPAVFVRTNLRSHPLIASVAWERAHGGALAAVGHVLGEGVSEVLISSS
ncbi:MAG: hypothetical protein ABIS67_10640, partial [Candidatus Eisenbacteria bacterium]